MKTFKKIMLIALILIIGGCKKECYRPKQELTKKQIDSIFRTKLIMKK